MKSQQVCSGKHNNFFKIQLLWLTRGSGVPFLIAINILSKRSLERLKDSEGDISENFAILTSVEYMKLGRPSAARRTNSRQI